MTLMADPPKSRLAAADEIVSGHHKIGISSSNLVSVSAEHLPLNHYYHGAKSKAVFNYDPELFSLCLTYLREKNHHGLALLARQKGIPSFLRFKVWPVLLKHHPFVLNPFLQPDNIEVKHKKKKPSFSSSPTASDSGEKSDSSYSSSTSTSTATSTSTTPDSKLKAQISKDLRKYIQRLNFSKEKALTETETQIFDILEHAIYKFITKWGRIIKYDKAMAWVALGLAEWFPPIPKTAWVLVGRNISLNDRCYRGIFDEYQEYITSSTGETAETLADLIDNEAISNMKFLDVFERLTLVLLHSPEKELNGSSNGKINKSTLPKNGGTIEERVSFFIYLLRKLLPELSTYFQEEQILNKFGSNDDEWLIWWLKWCGSKVWSRHDRGRIWDLMLGYKSNDSKNNRKLLKLQLDSLQLSKLGPDTFWSAIDISKEPTNDSMTSSSTTPLSSSASTTNDYSASNILHKANSFKDLIEELRVEEEHSQNQSQSQSQSQSQAQTQQQNQTNFLGSGNNTNMHSRRSSTSSASSSGSAIEIPISRIDPHIELIFISLALLKSKEHTLVELDQHEIRQYLSKLPSKSYNPSDKYKQHILRKELEKEGKREKEKEKEKEKINELTAKLEQIEVNSINNPVLNSNGLISNWKRLSGSSTSTTEFSQSMSQHYPHKVNYIDNVLNEAGELWRKWLWREMMEDE